MGNLVQPSECTHVHLADTEVKKLRALSRLLRAGGLYKDFVEGSPMRFDMSAFYRSERVDAEGEGAPTEAECYVEDTTNPGRHTCGSAACALGHMPMLGGSCELTPAETDPGDIDWHMYALHQFPSLFSLTPTMFVSWSNPASFMFGSWHMKAHYIDTPTMVAERIDYFLLWRCVPQRRWWHGVNQASRLERRG